MIVAAAIGLSYGMVAAGAFLLGWWAVGRLPKFKRLGCGGRSVTLSQAHRLQNENLPASYFKVRENREAYALRCAQSVLEWLEGFAEEPEAEQATGLEIMFTVVGGDCFHPLKDDISPVHEEGCSA